MSSGSKTSSKSSIKWIHCNQCFENFTHKVKPIFILSCYDVACETCLTRVNQTEFKCPICEKLVKGHQIDNSLPPNLKELFHPKPWTFNFQKALAIVQFQTKQRNKFLTGCRRMAAYNKTLERERDRLRKECRDAYLLHQKTRHENKQLEKALKNFLKKRKDVSARVMTHNESRRELSFDFPSVSRFS